MNKGQAYITAIGAAVTTALACGLLGTGGGIVFAVGILGGVLGALLLGEDAKGCRRFLVPGVLSLAVALLPGVSEAAASGTGDPGSIGNNFLDWCITTAGSWGWKVGVIMVVAGGITVGLGRHRNGALVAISGAVGIVLSVWAAGGGAYTWAQTFNH